MEEIIKRENILNLLNEALTASKNRGLEWAEAEQNYRSALAKEILKLKASGHAATLINDLARGDESISLLKLERDSSKVLYDSAKEAINVYKRALSVIENDIEAIRRGQ